MLGLSEPDCVKVAVQVLRPICVSPETMPPVTVMSEASKPETGSLKLKVRVVESPGASKTSAAEIVRVGAVASSVPGA